MSASEAEEDESFPAVSDKSVSIPALLLSEEENPALSAETSMQQLQLPINEDVQHKIMQLLGFQLVSYGCEQKRIRLLYYSNTSTIK